MTPPASAPTAGLLSLLEPVLSCTQMRAIDAAVISATGLPGLVLMENAGRGVADVVLRRWRARGGDVAAPVSVAVVCGGGNNGGDGMVVARHLAQHGGGAIQAHVLMVSSPDRLSVDAAVMWRALEQVPGVTRLDLSGAATLDRWRDVLSGSDVIVDAIFGTGLRAPPDGAAAAAIVAINESAALTVAVDIPSGLDGDTGRALGTSVRADVTVAIAARKIGLVVDPGAGVGQLEVVGFGVPIVPVIPSRALGPFGFWIDEPMARALLPIRQGGAHKGTGGHLIVVAGSAGKTGAAVLASRAALRAGAGLVTVASTAAGCVALDAKVVEVMTATYTEGDEAASDSFDRLRSLVDRPNVRAVAVGPGIPVGPGMAELVHRLVRELPLPLVIDADGLNLLGDDAAAVLAGAAGPRVITPHPGEMGRLCGGRSTADVQADRVNTARRFAGASKAVVVLKGARTLVAAPDGTVFVNPTVEPALATAGSGDVLTGLLAALIAQGMDPLAAACAAVYLHGCAGTRAAGVYGPTGVLAGDLPDAIAAIRAGWSAESVKTR